MSWLEDLERKIQEGISGIIKPVAGAPKEKTLIELCKDMLEDVRGRILVQERGIRTFPYNRLDLLVFVKDDEQKAAYESVFEGDAGFANRIVEMLAEEGCRPRELNSSIRVTVDPQQAVLSQPYVLRCTRDGAAKAAKPSGERRKVRLTILKGKALDMADVTSDADRINLGRLREVMSTSGGVVRVNDLAFAEDETNVAREHAFLRWNAAAGAYQLYDAISGSRGTRLFRSGESYSLPKGASKGTTLRHGDEIHLGTARIKFEVIDDFESW